MQGTAIRNSRIVRGYSLYLFCKKTIKINTGYARDKARGKSIQRSRSLSFQKESEKESE